MDNKQISLELLKPYDCLSLPNRIVMAPMTRCGCDSDGVPSEALADYYIKRAEAGIGLIIVESCAVNANDARGYLNGCELSNIDQAKAWRAIVEKIHAAGSKVWIQLFHAGRLSPKEITGSLPIAPSAIGAKIEQESFWWPKNDGQFVHFQTKTPLVEPKQMSLSDIERVHSEFEAACILAAYAGFDGVEIHGAHGYLVHEFCSYYANLREDRYGLSEGFSFASELVERCKKNLPPSMVLSYRVSCHMIDNIYLRLTDVDFEKLIPLLDSKGVDVFHSSELNLGENAFRSSSSLGDTIKRLTDKPIIGCGKVVSLLNGERILDSKCYDLIAFGRPLIIDTRIPYSEQDSSTFSYNEHFYHL